VNVPRSALLLSVLECLRDHPHDDTAGRVARRLGWATMDDVQTALIALEHDELVMRAAGHWQLTLAGWRAAGPRPTEE
jgi:hypothetical protein